MVQAEPRGKLDDWQKFLVQQWGRRVSYSDTVDFLADMAGPPTDGSSRKFSIVEFVEYDPEDASTFPSVCHTPEDVERRFGFTGGELLVFDSHGSYLHEATKQVGGDNESLHSV
jgi:hypothetical protein